MTRFIPMYSGEYGRAALDALMDAERLSPLTARALYRRGIRTPMQAEAFLHPSPKQFCDPFLLPDMQKAVCRIRRAAETGEKVCVYGDYDADGICASAILLNAFSLLGIDAVCYIPSRKAEGYGLNDAAIDKLHAAGVTLIVTVDNGVNAAHEAETCRTLGIDLVVTDHHSVDERMPVCEGVVAATRMDSQYPNDKLSGAGVALKLSQALLPQTDHAWDLTLAAVATVADVMPLTEENRAIVTLGMLHLPDHAGLRTLLQTAGWENGEITEHTLAFLIAPRLNASGRVGNAMCGVSLLRSESREQAAPYAAQLEADNAERKETEARILADAQAKLAAMDAPRRGVVLCSEEWNFGVIGIVASRLCETYHLPVMLFTSHDGVVTGSGRSPDGVNLFALLTRFAPLFLRYGGHARAAGVTMAAEMYETFRTGFLAALEEYDEACFAPSFSYEEEAELGDFSVEAVDELRLLAPFGEGNPEPAFLIRSAAVQNIRTMGKNGTHLSAAVMADGTIRRMVAFRCGSLKEKLQKQRMWDLLVKPTVNRFREREEIELNYVACKENADGKKLFDAFFADTMYNEMYANDMLAEWVRSVEPYTTGEHTPEAYRERYRQWRRLLDAGDVTADRLTALAEPDMLMAFAVFYELGFFVRDDASDAIVLNAGAGARELTESTLYRLIAARQ